MNALLFSEKQRFSQPGLPILLIATSTVSITVAIFMAPVVSVWVIAVLLGALVSLLGAHLHTEVRTDGVYYRFFPFHTTFRCLSPETIKQYEIRRYDPIGEYGGWGLRRSRSNGKAYHARGDVGMQLVLVNGKKILFGTQQEAAFQRAMDSLKKQPRAIQN